MRWKKVILNTSDTKHSFIAQNGTTVMIDFLQYDTPYGIFGKLFDKVALKKPPDSFSCKEK